jgi:CubicO group peptidase (beta-lactamase class C family)
MTGLKAEVDPAEVGFDPARLERIDRLFGRYVDDGRLPGWLIAVSRHGKLAYVSTYGSRDLEAGLPVESDTLWRIFSMTKAITSVAAMMLYEEGGFELGDPLSRYIPSFADARVYSGGSDLRPVTVPAMEPVRIWHLLTHTAGLTYGFLRNHPVDAMYRAQGFEWGSPAGSTWPAASTSGRACRCCSSRARSGTTRWPRMCSAGWSRWCRARAWTSSSRAASWGRWA